jgi:hypothetical protein
MRLSAPTASIRFTGNAIPVAVELRTVAWFASPDRCGPGRPRGVAISIKNVGLLTMSRLTVSILRLGVEQRRDGAGRDQYQWKGESHLGSPRRAQN